MSIQLVTYANQTVTPTNDAIIYERAIDQNGIFYGCNVTVSGNEVHITGGYGIVCGREFTIQSDVIAVTLAPSGTLDGRLYVRLDLADADDPIQLLTATGNTLPPLEQDSDVNYTNGAYEMELATFTVGVSALSDVVETFETIIGTKQGIKKASLWSGAKKYSGTFQIPNWEKYDYLIFMCMTNTNYFSSVCPSSFFSATNKEWNVAACVQLSSPTVASLGITRTNTDTFSLAESHTNANWVLGVYEVIGIKLGW